MTVEKHVARLVAAVLAVTVVLVVGPAGDVMAAPPNITIDHPLTGSSTANQTPPFSGTTDDILDPVTLYIYAGVGASGSPVQTLTVLALLELTPLEGTWATEPESALEPGQYTAVAEQTNVEPPAGQSAPVTFTVDTSPPSVSIASVPSPTNDSTPTLTGGAGTAAGDDPTVAVAIYEGGSVSGSPVRTMGGTVSGSTWTAGPVVSLPDGTYTAQVSQGDEAGNIGTSVAVTFTVDTVAPAVSLGSVPSPTKDSTPTLTGGAGTAAGDDPTVAVAIYEGGSVSGSPVRTVGGTVSGSTWTAGPVALPDGTYTAQVSQGDEAGNIGTSVAVTFTVDTSPPSVSIASVPSPTKDSTPTLTGGAGTAAGDDPTVAVAIYEGGSVSGSPVRTVGGTVSGSTWTAGPVALPDGTYTAQVSQSDVAGNTGKSVAVTFTVDTTPPTVTIASVPSPTNDPTPMLAGSAGIAVGDESTATVTIYQGGTVAGAIATSKSVSVSGGGWSYTPPKLNDGTYTAQVSQSDVAGNTGASAAVTFTVDTSPPVVAVTVPAAGAVLNSSNPTVSGLAGQASGDDPLVALKLYAGSTVSGSPIQTDKVTPSGANWTTGAVSALADGTYTVLAEQSDEAGNTGTSAAVTFTVDTTLPAVTLTSPAYGSSTSAEFESFSGAAGSAAGDLPQVTLKLFAGSTITNEAPLKEVTVPAVNGHWSAAFGGLSSGTYTAQAQQSDDLGRTGLSEPVTFTVNIPVPGTPPVTPPAVGAPSAETTPSPPVASFNWFPSAPHTGEAISLVSTSTDATSPIIGFAWSLSGDGAFGAGAPTLTTSFSTPGAHVVLLRVTDANGLSSVVAETIPVTSRAPTLMQPFPVVRIAGSENASGVRVGLLTVQAPVGATVNVSCRGPGCRARSQDVVATSGRSKSKAGMVLIVFRRFERTLRAGAALEIRVSKPGQIGKYTRFAVRHAKLPARVDTCLSPAGIKPIVCPSS